MPQATKNAVAHTIARVSVAAFNNFFIIVFSFLRFRGLFAALIVGLLYTFWREFSTPFLKFYVTFLAKIYGAFALRYPKRCGHFSPLRGSFYPNLDYARSGAAVIGKLFLVMALHVGFVKVQNGTLSAFFAVAEIFLVQ